MKQRRMGARLWSSLFGCSFTLVCAWFPQPGHSRRWVRSASPSWIPAAAAVPGATLTLTDVATNDARTAVTQEAGNHTFVNLNFGPHKLTVSLQGFATQSYDVLVQSARTTDVKATLKVGGMTEVVEVSGGGAAGGDLDQRDQHDHRHETDRRSAPGRPQHRATVAVDRRLQRHLERAADVCAEQLDRRHRRQHQPLALSDLRQRRVHRGHAALGEHRGNGGQFRSDRHEPGLRQLQHDDHVRHPPWHQPIQWPAVRGLPGCNSWTPRTGAAR